MTFNIIFLMAILLRVILFWKGIGSLDLDEAEIITYGRELWKNHLFQIYLPSGLHWELVSAYLFGGLDLISPYLPKLLSFLLSLFDLYFLYKICQRFMSEKTALVALLLMATSPWHLHYSNITGTINLCLSFTLFFIWLNPKNHLVRIALHSIGLMIYPAYRAFYLVDGFFLWKKRSWKKLLSNAMALLFSLFFIYVVHHQIAIFFNRGQHNFVWSYGFILKNYSSFLIAPFIWPLSYYKIVASNSFVADYTHYALANILHGPPLGHLCALLVPFGLWGLFKTKRLKQLLPYYLVPFVALGFMGPSFARMYIMLPLFVMTAALGLEFLERKWPTFSLLYLVAFLALFSAADYIYFRSQPELNDVVFHRRFFLISEELKKPEYKFLSEEKPITIIAGPGYNVWKYLLVTNKIEANIVPSFLFDQFLFPSLRANKLKDGTQWFFIHDFSSDVDAINEGAQYVRGRQKVMDYLDGHTLLLERIVISHGEMRVGQLIKVIWTK